MSNSEFALLQVAVNQRINKEKFGANTIEELAIKDGRNACCPSCGSIRVHKDGVTQTKVPRQNMNVIIVVIGSLYSLIQFLIP